MWLEGEEWRLFVAALSLVEEFEMVEKLEDLGRYGRVGRVSFLGLGLGLGLVRVS